MELNLTDKQNMRRSSNDISSVSSMEESPSKKHAKVEMVVSSESEGFALCHHQSWKCRHVVGLQSGTTSTSSIDRRRSQR